MLPKSCLRQLFIVVIIIVILGMMITLVPGSF